MANIIALMRRGTLMGILDFDQNDRGVWVCISLVNTAGVKKLKLSS